MKEVWLTLEEAAELEGCTYNAIQLRAKTDNIYKTKTESGSENGGRDRVYIGLSSLSKKARNLYREKQKIDISRLNENSLSDENVPWYVFVDWGWYKDNNKKYYNEGIELSKHVKDCVEYNGKGKTEYVNQYAEELGIKPRAFRRYMKNYTEAGVWAMEMSKNDGKNYEYMKILALCRKPREKTGRTSLTKEMEAVIENIWFNPEFAQNLCKYAKLYRLFCDEMRERGEAEEDLPSYDSVVRYIKDFRETTDNARVMVAKGMREFRRTSMVKRRRDLKTLKVMELVVADTHTFDCFVTITASNGKKRAFKPCLVGFMDMRSRALVGWGICEIPTSQVIKEVMIHMVSEKKNKANPFGGVPRVLLIDNGKDYTAESLTGRKRTVRVETDIETDGFYSEIGIERDMRSLPYQAWTKGEIERFFGSVCEDFSKGINSYTGTLTGSMTGAKVKKDIKRMLERDELLDINEFADRFEYWVLNVYSKRIHTGLKKQEEKYFTPIEVYKNEERYYKPAPPIEYLERMAMVKEHKKVWNTGIKLFGCDYMCEELFPYINSKKGVTVRYNPKDIREINVYDIKTDKLICKAQNASLLNPLAPVGDKDLENHIKSQNRQIREAKRIIENASAAYEERMDAETIERKERVLILPEIKEAKEQKVVAMPKNGRYLADKKEFENIEEAREADEWMKKQAQNALNEIRKIGG